MFLGEMAVEATSLAKWSSLELLMEEDLDGSPLTGGSNGNNNSLYPKKNNCFMNIYFVIENILQFLQMIVYLVRHIECLRKLVEFQEEALVIARQLLCLLLVLLHQELDETLMIIVAPLQFLY